MSNMSWEVIANKLRLIELLGLPFTLTRTDLGDGEILDHGENLEYDDRVGVLVYRAWREGRAYAVGIPIGALPSTILTLWTPEDDCTDCGDRLVTLEEWVANQPVCNICAREAWESERAEGVSDDARVGL